MKMFYKEKNFRNKDKNLLFTKKIWTHFEETLIHVCCILTQFEMMFFQYFFPKISKGHFIVNYDSNYFAYIR